MFESWEGCAQREVREETGLEISNVRLVHIQNNCWPLKNKHYVTIFLAAAWESGIATPGKGHEYADWQWYDQIPKPLFESDEALRIFLEKERYNLTGALRTALL